MRLAYKHMVAITYAIALFLDRLDLTIVNIALPTLAKEFAIPFTSTDWVSLSFLLALAIAIPISCWLGERYGFKKIYILAMMLFGLGSTLCAWAPNIQILMVLRFIHGIGGGMLIPVGMTIVYRLYSKSEYASITSFTLLPSLFAPAIAPCIGGILIDVWSWQAIFLLSGPICLGLALVSTFLLREQWEKNRSELDWGGFVLFAAILLDAFYLLSLIGKSQALAPFSVAAALLVGLVYYFIQHEGRATLPLIDLRYFSNRVFITANFIQLCFQICHFGAIFLIAMYLQIGVGLSATMAGLVMGMQALGAIMTSRYSVKLFNRHGAKLPITVGLLGVCVLTPCVMLINSVAMLWFALPLFFCRGIFSGLCGTPIQTLSVIGVEKGQLGAINTIFNACRQLSISVGVAISSGLMTAGLYRAHLTMETHVMNAHDSLSVFGFGFFAISIIAIIGIAIVQSLQPAPNLNQPIGPKQGELA